jgi:hypothetical protein
MNKYQLLFLACIYAGVAYGAYRERQANNGRFEPLHYWRVGFLFCTLYLLAAGFVFIFIFLGAL